MHPHTSHQVRPGDSLSPGDPFLSVVLVASRHPEYLPAALESLRSQTLDPARWELVVVMDFENATIESVISAAGGLVVRVGSVSAGAAMAVGVRQSRGEVVSLLDDDDLFSPDKLDEVARRFQKDPSLGYLQNGYSLIDSDGLPIRSHPFRARERQAASKLAVVSIGGPARIDQLRRLPSVGLGFNGSCISARRQPLLEFLSHLEVEELCLPDSAVFFAAMTSGLNVCFDSRQLTKYRLHTSNVSMTNGARPDLLEGRRRFSSKMLASYPRIIRALEQLGQVQLAEEAKGQYAVAEGYSALREPASGRATFSKVRRELSRFRHTYAVRSDPALRTGILFACTWPALAKWLYIRQVRRLSGG